ncbi:MAG: hypothetical protein M5U17_01840 [Ignavibacterium sp.]|nr:hypothetical protein [Ignavibacterium sp.]
MRKNNSAIQKVFNSIVKKRIPNVILIDNGKSLCGSGPTLASGKLQDNGYTREKLSPHYQSKSSIENELRQLQQLNNVTI